MNAVALVPPVGVGGFADGLRILNLPIPQPGRDEVLVRVMASSINIDDIHIIEGTMFGGLPVGPRVGSGEVVVPGTDVAGIVESTGDNAGHFRPGEFVFGTHVPTDASGGWAEYCCVRQDRLQLKPLQWSHEEAAACALGGMVATAALEAVGWREDGRYAVVGASGGIGSLITKALVAKGAETHGICGPANIELVRGFGAVPLDYTGRNFGDALSELDGVIDCVGGLETEHSASRALRRDGAFVTLAGPERYIGERKLAWWKIAGIFWHIGWRSIYGHIRGPRYVMVAPGSRHATLIAPWLADAGVAPLIDKIIPLEAAAVADGVRLVRSHRARGKVVVQTRERS